MDKSIDKTDGFALSFGLENSNNNPAKLPKSGIHGEISMKNIHIRRKTHDTYNTF